MGVAGSASNKAVVLAGFSQPNIHYRVLPLFKLWRVKLISVRRTGLRLTLLVLLGIADAYTYFVTVNERYAVLSKDVEDR